MDAPAFPNPFKTELPADQPLIVMTRTFAAPLALVWKVWTESEHVARWWGPHDQNQVEQYDVETGGKWRVVSTMPDGSVVTFFGTYLAVEPQTLIRNTFVVEGMFEEDPRFYEEHQFEERDGVTHYRSVSNLPDFDMRDATANSGMEWGANASMAKFDAILAEIVPV
jgi:uncharacterized protein YndB with AHSA1/START domain